MILEITVNLNHNFIYGYNNKVSVEQITLNRILFIVTWSIIAIVITVVTATVHMVT